MCAVGKVMLSNTGPQRTYTWGLFYVKKVL